MNTSKRIFVYTSGAFLTRMSGMLQLDEDYHSSIFGLPSKHFYAKRDFCGMELYVCVFQVSHSLSPTSFTYRRLEMLISCIRLRLFRLQTIKQIFTLRKHTHTHKHLHTTNIYIQLFPIHGGLIINHIIDIILKKAYLHPKHRLVYPLDIGKAYSSYGGV